MVPNNPRPTLNKVFTASLFAFVFIIFPILSFAQSSANEITLEQEIENLKDANYCKKTFGLFVPMLVPYSKKKVYRYYSPTTILTIYEKQYLLTNDWYEDAQRHQLKPLLTWIAEHKN